MTMPHGGRQTGYLQPRGRLRARLTRADRRQLSLVDCVSFETMERDAIGIVLAVDEHFRDAGFRVVP